MLELIIETFILNRLGYGHSAEDIALLKEIGYEKYLEQQLNPDEADDPVLKEKLAEASFPMNMGRGKEVDKPLFLYEAPVKTLWVKEMEGPEFERRAERAVNEVMYVSLMRAVYSKWQLKEQLVAFWHNHFNVNVEADERIQLLFPLYDKVVRKHAFGNFRAFLEEVAKSPAMLYYLNNASSKASPANENFARELFELMTLGADHYLNHLYNRWREVPGAFEGKAEGYIDEDVYEAARAFTGWTVADGSEDERGGILPNTGEFYYFEGWHDNYQKRVLGVEFYPNEPAMADGRKVLDLVAYHPGTALHLCEKLCRRFVSDNPSEALIKQAADTWMKHQKSDNQIQEVMRTILLSQEFSDSLGKKLRNPLELFVAFWRAMGMEFKPNEEHSWFLYYMGYRHFRWPTPTGHPDVAEHWVNSFKMLTRWNLIPMLFEQEWEEHQGERLMAMIPTDAKSCHDIVYFWSFKILGNALPVDTHDKIVNYLAMGGVGTEPPFVKGQELEYIMLQVIAIIAMTPQFQYR